MPEIPDQPMYVPVQFVDVGKAPARPVIHYSAPFRSLEAAKHAAPRCEVYELIKPGDRESAYRAGREDAAREGYEQAIATLRGVVERTGSPTARWAADYLAADPDWLAPADYDDHGRWTRTDRPELLSDRLGYPPERGDQDWAAKIARGEDQDTREGRT